MSKPKNGIYRSESGAAAVGSRYSAFLQHWPLPNEQRHVATRLGDTLVGAKDPWMDAAEIQHRFNALVPGAQVQILPERGHLLVGLTQPILQFLHGNA